MRSAHLLLGAPRPILTCAARSGQQAQASSTTTLAHVTGQLLRPHTHTSHTATHSHTCSTITLWTWQPSLGQLLATRLPSRHKHACTHKHTCTNKHTAQTHIPTHTHACMHIQTCQRAEGKFQEGLSQMRRLLEPLPETRNLG